MGIRVVLLAIAWVALMLPYPAMAEPVGDESPGGADEAVFIYEIKLGGGEDPDLREYIRLYNASGEAISLDQWVLEYAKLPQPQLDTTFCVAPSWSNSAGITVGQTDLSGMTLAPNTVSDPIVRQLNDSGPGSLRLLDASEPGQTIVHDVVGWGEEAPCAETLPAEIPSQSTSLIRYLGCDAGLPIDTDDNSADFAVSQSPGPGSLGAVYQDGCQDPDESLGPTLPAPLSCEGVVISEVLPNAAGSDTGHEFIEIYNPTADFIDLAGCGLQLAGDDFIYRFGSAILEPEQYQALSDLQTTITLPNSAGGTLFLLSAADEELQTVTYPADLDDDVAWAWFGGLDWQQTYVPSPNTFNVSQPTEPCPSGETRSQESGRCVTSVVGNEGQLQPCGPGKERNPETNRCRSVASTAAALTACKPGQQRNPETNRCRSVASAASQLKPCKEGQERNPETNRCRNVAGATNGGNGEIQDVKAASSAMTYWWAAGAAATIAAGYGVWEWRRELMGFASRFTRRFVKTSQ